MHFFWRHRREVSLLVLIVGVAAFLRFFMLQRFPAGLYFDEAANVVDALETLRTGNWPAFYNSQGGKEALWFWLLATTFSIAGFGILQMRVLAAVIGLLTVGAVWWAARELFSADQEGSAADLALLSAAALATLFVHVHFSRDGYRLLTQPLVGSLAMGALWRALRTKRWKWFLLGGALLGLAMYTYAAARFYLVLLAVFFPLEWLLAQPRRHSMLRRHFGALAGMIVIAAVVFAPMGLYLIEKPELILHRSSQVSVFNSTWNQGQPWSAVLDSVWRNYAGLVWRGTMDNHWNIPGRPLLDVLTIPLFLLGVITSVRRWRHPVYLFLLLWLVVLYLPAVLSYDRAPTFHRSQGATPAVVMLVAVGAWTAWRWIAARGLRRSWKVGATVPLCAILLISGTITFRDYFLGWGPSWEAYLATQPYYLELVELMNAEPEDRAVYLLPYDLRNGEYEHPDLQLFYHGSSPYFSISDHEGELLAALTKATAGREVVRVVDWKVGRSVEADPKGLIPALLTMYGQPLGAMADTPAYRIEGFRLAGLAIDFRSIPPLQAVNSALGDGLILKGFNFGPTNRAELAIGNPLSISRSKFDAPGRSVTGLQRVTLAGVAEPGRADPLRARKLDLLSIGGYAWVILQWRTEGPTSADYKASVRLIDGDTTLAHQDKLLINGFHLSTTDWHPGEENYDVFILPLAQTGQYRLQVVVYDAGTMKELVPGGLTLPGEVEVGP